MQRLIASFLLLVVISTSFQLGVGVHLCGDSIKSIAFLSKAKACNNQNGTCPSAEHHHSLSRKSCCTDAYLCADLDIKREVVSDELKISVPSIAIIRELNKECPAPEITGQQFESVRSESPPLPSNERLFLKFSVFRI